MYEKNPDRTESFTARIHILGKGGHSSVPYLTLNPVPAAFRLIQIVSGKILYEFDSFQNVRLAPLSFDAGTKQNIIPDEAELLFKGESCCPENTEKLKAILENTSKAIEILYQLKITISYEASDE